MEFASNKTYTIVTPVEAVTSDPLKIANLLAEMFAKNSCNPNFSE